MLKHQVFNRLYERGQESLFRRDQLNSEKSKVISSECTFVPHLSLGKRKKVRQRQKVVFTVTDSLEAIVRSIEALGTAATAKAYVQRYQSEVSEALAKRKREATKVLQGSRAPSGRNRVERFDRLYKNAMERRDTLTTPTSKKQPSSARVCVQAKGA